MDGPWFTVPKPNDYFSIFGLYLLRFWEEIKRLSDKCEKEGFYVPYRGKVTKCQDGSEENCCLTMDQWKPTQCNKETCEDPVKALPCS